MIGPLFAIIGFLWGYLVARRRGGKTVDRLQYGAGFAIAFGLLGTLLSRRLYRSLSNSASRNFKFLYVFFTEILFTGIGCRNRLQSLCLIQCRI